MTPKLLELLELKIGSVTSVSTAMGCRRIIAEQIRDGNGDCVPEFRSDQGTAEDTFARAGEKSFEATPHDPREKADRDYECSEICCDWVTEELRTLHNTKRWKVLHTIGMIDAGVGKETGIALHSTLSSTRIIRVSIDSVGWVLRVARKSIPSPRTKLVRMIPRKSAHCSQ